MPPKKGGGRRKKADKDTAPPASVEEQAAEAAAAAAVMAEATTPKSEDASAAVAVMPGVASHLEPPDSTTYLTDLVEYLVEMIFIDRNGRQKYYDSLRKIYSLHPAHSLEFGRLYGRIRLAELLKDACSERPYLDPKKVSAAKSAARKKGVKTAVVEVLTTNMLVTWDRSKWEDFADDLQAVADMLRRTDVTATFDTDEESSNGRTDQWASLEDATLVEPSSRLLFEKRLATIQTMIRIQAAIAPIRVTVENQIRGTRSTGPPKVEEDKAAEFISYVNNSGDRIVSQVCSLLIDTPSEDSNEQTPRGKNSTGKKHVLANIDEFRQVLRDSKFLDLEYLQDKVENLVHKWNCNVFGRLDPELIRLGYRLPNFNVRRATAISKEDRVHIEGPRSERKAKRPSSVDGKDVQALQAGRENLREGHGQDPLEESREIAADAGLGLVKFDEPMTPSLKRMREVEAEIPLSQQLEREDQEDEDERAKLSELPDKMSTARKKRRKSDPAKMYRKVQPEDGIFDENGKVRRRRRWSEEEKRAVKEGVKKFGIGKWVQIKDEYSDILRNRTGVQIKDVWRTMQNNQEC